MLDDLKETDITIGGKEYHVYVAQSQEEKETGLSEVRKLPKDEGMIFVYDEPQKGLWFTMEDTSIGLDIIFIDESGKVTSVHSVDAFDQDPIKDRANNAKFVLEVNIESGIKRGDYLEDFEIPDDEDSDEDEQQVASYGRMLVLNSEGDVQMTLQGGERIFSRKNTKSLIKAALKAFKTDNDADYKMVGRLVFKYLNKQDTNEPEYVNSPD